MANTPAPRPTASPGSDPPRAYCSEQNPSEPLWGTADTVDVWLCLEYRPVWQARAVTDNTLATRTRDWLEETVAALADVGLKARPQFIRQPQHDREDTRLLVTAAGRTLQWSGTGYDFLLDLDLARWLRPGGEPASGGVWLDTPQYLVCTNGQRDVCCARYGLPLYAALAERVGDRAWQVTHLGGHRFAPNVLTLPDACLYGRVTPHALDDFISRVDAGETDFPRLRGRTCYPPIVQSAEAALGRQGLRLLHVDGNGDAAQVTFADAHERLSVAMAMAALPERIVKSCGDEVSEVYPFVRA